MITRLVRIKAQRRVHRKSRVNKKWRNRYGTIEFSIPEGAVDTHRKIMEAIQYMRGIMAHSKPIPWSDREFAESNPEPSLAATKDIK